MAASLSAKIERNLGSARRLVLTTMFPGMIARSREHAVAAYRQSLKKLPAEQWPLLDSLRRTGFVRTSIAALESAKIGLPIDPSLLSSNPDISPFGDPTVQFDTYLTGLNRAAIDFVEVYLGLPVLYLGAALKVEKADGRAIGTRQWHCDIEDQSMLRFLIYLRDVDAAGGALQLLDEEQSTTLADGRRFRNGFLDGDHVERLGQDKIIDCTGERGTVIIFDGARLFHRASPPTQRDRHSLTFSYSSRRPLQLIPSARPPKDVFKRIAAHVGNDQLACVPAPR